MNYFSCVAMGLNRLTLKFHHLHQVHFLTRRATVFEAVSTGHVKGNNINWYICLSERMHDDAVRYVSVHCSTYSLFDVFMNIMHYV